MRSILRAEAAKLRHDRILRFTFIGNLLPSLISTIMVLDSREPYTWQSWYLMNLQFQVVLVAPPLFATFSGYLFAREYQDKTINMLFTYPYARSSFFIGKMLIAAATITSVLIISCAINVGIAIFLLDEAVSTSEWLLFLKLYVAVGILFVSLIPLWMFVGMIGRSSIPATISGTVMIMIPGPVGGSAAYRDIIGLIWRLATGEAARKEIAAISAILFALFAVFLLLSLFYCNKADVHSGS
jgi:hypothetical protein